MVDSLLIVKPTRLGLLSKERIKRERERKEVLSRGSSMVLPGQKPRGVYKRRYIVALLCVDSAPFVRSFSLALAL